MRGPMNVKFAFKRGRNNNNQTGLLSLKILNRNSVKFTVAGGFEAILLRN